MPGNKRRPTALYRKLSRKGFYPEHVAEVGVHRPDSANVYDYIVQGVRCTLVEPDPDCVREIHERFASQENVTLHPVAIFDSHGEVELARRGASTFVAQLTTTPATVNDRYKVRDDDKIVVQARTFDEVDDGTIDLLCIDVEGSEWFVIKRMTSRPAVISVETHGHLYRNPYFDEITGWMDVNGYVLLARGTSDSIFVKRGTLTINPFDKFELAMSDVYLTYKRLARRAKHSFQPR